MTAKISESKIYNALDVIEPPNSGCAGLAHYVGVSVKDGEIIVKASPHLTDVRDYDVVVDAIWLDDNGLYIERKDTAHVVVELGKIHNFMTK